MTVRPWPAVDHEDHWLTAALEQQIVNDDRSPEELRKRADELREDAGKTDAKGTRDASLALAERYEAAAAARLTTH